MIGYIYQKNKIIFEVSPTYITRLEYNNSTEGNIALKNVGTNSRHLSTTSVTHTVNQIITPPVLV